MNQMKHTWLSVLGIAVGAITLSSLPATSYAQAVPEPAPAMHLKDVPAVPGIPSLTVSDAAGNAVHILPTVPHLAAINRAKAAVGNSDIRSLVYHAGGSVMTGDLKIYTIFWLPAHHSEWRRNQHAGGLSNGPKEHGRQLWRTRPFGHQQQYYQTISGRTTYINGNALLGGSVVDTGGYPARTCNDSATRGNCLTER